MPAMKTYSVSDPKFSRYGRIVKGFDSAELLQVLRKKPLPKDGTIYVASDAELEKLDIFSELLSREFGELPIQIGYCNGINHKLNALEYHRSSEINISADDMVLLLGSLQDVDSEDYTYDTSLVEMYATTLHFAPCSSEGRSFRNVIILPRGTNEPLKAEPKKELESKLLFAANKWMIAHPEFGLDGAFEGLKGENITIK